MHLTALSGMVADSVFLPIAMGTPAAYVLAVTIDFVSEGFVDLLQAPSLTVMGNA